MNDKYQNIEIDELISLYLDEQATERQQTELKRLMQHDLSITKRLEELQRQKQLLNALPIEAAPASLADDVRGAMERKLILAEPSGQSQSVLATGHLYARRLMAIAAMFLLPIGLLALVVFQIMKPPVESPPEYVVNSDILEETPEVILPTGEGAGIVGTDDELPFKGTLVLQTGEFMAVDKAVRDAIEKQDLLANVFPGRTADVSRFEMTASPKQVADLVDALAGIRPQCTAVKLEVQSRSTDEVIEIENVDNEQLKILVYEDNPGMFDRLAECYADANADIDPLFEEVQPDGYPEPSIPTLAGNYETDDRTVQLTIQVERAAEE